MSRRRVLGIMGPRGRWRSSARWALVTYVQSAEDHALSPVSRVVGVYVATSAHRRRHAGPRAQPRRQGGASSACRAKVKANGMVELPSSSTEVGSHNVDIVVGKQLLQSTKFAAAGSERNQRSAGGQQDPGRLVRGHRG